MTIVGAIIGSLVCGASGYFAGYMKGASKWFDEIENREATTILNNVTARTTVVALGANMNIFLGCLLIYITKSELQTQQIRPYLHQRFKR